MYRIKQPLQKRAVSCITKSDFFSLASHITYIKYCKIILND